MERNILNYKVQINKVKRNNVTSDFEVTVLSPSNNLENEESYKNYEKRLISALNKDSVFNIAITGIYGSGKSSVLNTFKKQYQESQWNFLDVSLSTFQTISSEDQKSTELSSEEVQLIERSILQQFFYTVPQSKIPLSRFKRITGNSKYKEIVSYVVIVLLISSGLILFNSSKVLEDLVTLPKWLSTLSLIIFISTILVILYKFMQFSLNLTEIKLNFHDTEFNIKNDNEKSILNDHLDEILYFFETTKKNVVIIEDLDRFNNTEIFIRLRELNSIINKSCSHPVIFIYAIRDDMFEDNERSKFFDYIIPIIPIVNPTTAYDIIKKNYSDISDCLNDRFLLNTCLYFSDMRLLKNILNEYQVYFDQLKIIDIDKNKLFAMVVYKNYYPIEFAKLNSNDGEVYDIFNKEKLKIVKNLIASKEERLISLRLSKDKILSEQLNSIEELNSVYAYKILSKLDSMRWINHNYALNVEIRVDSNIYSAKDISSTEVLTDLSKHQNITFEVTSTTFSKTMKFNDIEQEVNSNSSYLERLYNLSSKKDGFLEDILDEEVDIQDEIQNTNKQNLIDLLRQSDIVTDKPILKYFVKNGFIDETYQNYISYFFEESISLNDKNYAILVNSFDDPNFELELKNCGELVETYLGLDKLSTQNALNFSMLDYLLTQPSKKIYLESYIKVICDGSSISVEFLKRYFKREEKLSVLIPKIIDLREIIIDDVGISGNTKESLFNFKNFIKHIPLNRYHELAYLTEEFKLELNSMEDYVDFVLECFDDDFDRFKAFTDAVRPILECADFSVEQTKELNWLGKNRYLAINRHMIKQVLLNNLEDSDIVLADLEVKPVTLIANSGIDYLTKNIWSENLLEYIRVILLGADENTSYSEDEDVYIKTLNLLGDPNAIVEKFIDSIATKIENIKEIENYFTQRYLIAHSKAEYLWSNVFYYFSESYYDDEGTYREIDSSLINFLESGQNLLQTASYSELDTINIENWTTTKEEFDERLFLCNNLSDGAYEKLIIITDGNWNNSSLDYLSQEKVQTLIVLGKLSLTPENWDQIKKHASNETIEAFLVKYHQTVIPDLDSVELRPEDIEVLFCSDEVSNEYKQVLAKSKAINLIESNETVRKKIIEIYESDRMSSPIYDQLLKYADSKELKKLLLKQIKYLDKHEVLKILELLDDPYQKLAKGEEVEFGNTEENRALLDALNKAQMVMKAPKAKKPKGSLIGEKVLTTRLQSHVLGS